MSPLLGYDASRHSRSEPVQEASIRVSAHTRVSKRGNVYHVGGYDRKLLQTTTQRLKRGESAALPDGVKITRKPDGKGFTVGGGGGSKSLAHRSAGGPPDQDVEKLDSAALLAMTRSARSRDPNSLGGARSYGSADEAEKEAPRSGSGGPAGGDGRTRGIRPAGSAVPGSGGRQAAGQRQVEGQLGALALGERKKLHGVEVTRQQDDGDQGRWMVNGKTVTGGAAAARALMKTVEQVAALSPAEREEYDVLMRAGKVTHAQAVRKAKVGAKADEKARAITRSGGPDGRTAMDRRRRRRRSPVPDRDQAIRNLFRGVSIAEEAGPAGRPGVNWSSISPAARKNLEPLVRHYARSATPHRACVRDQVKHGLSEDHANRRCAVIKDLIHSGTGWRKGNGKLKESETVAGVAAGFLPRVRALKQGEVARLPDGIAVKRVALEDGRDAFRIGTPRTYGEDGAISWGRTERDAERAASAAFRESAATEDPASLGGEDRLRTFTSLRYREKPARLRGATPSGQAVIRPEGSTDHATVSWDQLAPEAPQFTDASLRKVVEACEADLREAVRDLGEDGAVKLVEGEGEDEDRRERVTAAVYLLEALEPLAEESRAAVTRTGRVTIRGAQAQRRSDIRRGFTEPGKPGKGASDPDFESKHPRGGKGSAAGGKFVKKGSSGAEVRAIQRKVGVTPEGKFGDKTQAAVREFQKRHGLQVDGVVGRQTAAALLGKRGAAKVQVGRLKTTQRRALYRRGRRVRERLREGTHAVPLAEASLRRFAPTLHPRDPGGEGGGRFIRKGTSAAGGGGRTTSRRAPSVPRAPRPRRGGSFPDNTRYTPEGIRKERPSRTKYSRAGATRREDPMGAERRQAMRERPGGGRVARRGRVPFTPHKPLEARQRTKDGKEVDLGDTARELFGERYDSEGHYGIPMKGDRMARRGEKPDHYVYDQPDRSFPGDPPGVGKGRPRSARSDAIKAGFRIRTEADGREVKRKPPRGRRPVATVVIGGPASGKGGLGRGSQGESKGGVVLEDGTHVEPQDLDAIPANPDDVAVEYPENEYISDRGGNGRSAVHEEASTLTKEITTDALRDGYDLYADIVGGGEEGKLEKKLDEMVEAGHEVRVFSVLQDIEKARKQAETRYQRAKKKLEEGEAAGLSADKLRYLRRGLRRVEDSVLETGHRESSASTLRLMGVEAEGELEYDLVDGRSVVRGAKARKGVVTRVYAPREFEGEGESRLVAYTKPNGQVVVISRKFFELLRQKAVS